ncbi:hypothetical protein [Ornithinimicrobium cerasi]|uniref:hypothetical protein n=1 Tax=Ornithinimicrobium cerasi TaxID=2248773 RepID=UPI000EFECEE1|nr:hypothetical protein [Ornithinimicrobium cerasi]
MTGPGADRPWLPSDARLDDGVDLGGSTRSQVRRHQVLEGPPGWGSSVVVKRFLPQREGHRAATGYTRERVGLTHLPGTPRLLASHDPSRTLVLEDLGADSPTLADVLLAERATPGASGRDTSAAAYWQAIEWAGALGRTVRSPTGMPDAARAELADAAAEDRRVRQDYPRTGLSRLREVAGVRHAGAATAEILDAVERLERDTARHVLGPGDACPDNAVLTPAGVRLVDLEGAGVRHVAYEAAYAAEPFSTCWCVLTPPVGLTGAMLTAFTAGAGEHLPGLADDPDWPAQVRVAVAAWVLSGTLWLLDGAVADRAMAPAGRRGPQFRALLLSRWRRVVHECAEELPDVAAVCDEALRWALRAWRDGSPLELPPYPAFAD